MAKIESIDSVCPDQWCQRIRQTFALVRQNCRTEPEIAVTLSLNAFVCIENWLQRRCPPSGTAVPLPLAVGCDPATLIDRCEQHLVEYVLSNPSRELVRGAEIMRVCRHVEQNLSGDLSVKALADKSGWSTSYASRCFMNVMRVPLSGYVAARRMQYAAILVLKGLKVEAVMREVGYKNKTHFNQVFARHIGMTPRRYREHVARHPSP